MTFTIVVMIVTTSDRSTGTTVADGRYGQERFIIGRFRNGGAYISMEMRKWFCIAATATNINGRCSSSMTIRDPFYAVHGNIVVHHIRYVRRLFPES